MLNRMVILDHQLEHEAAHLAPLTTLGRIVVENGDIRGTLQQAVEIVGIDAYFVFDRCEFIGVTDAVGNK